MSRTPVDDLTADEIRLPRPLDRRQLEQAQLSRLRSAISRAISCSPFYRTHFAGLDPQDLRSFSDLARLPLLSAEDLSRSHHAMLCVSQTEISRIVTLQTSGSTGPPKRIYFTQNDLAATRTFFLHGMHSLITSEDRVLVLLPCAQEQSVGEQLLRALHSGGIEAHGSWPPPPATALCEQIEALGITSVVGLPQHLLALAHYLDQGKIRTMLLCSDYAPPALRMRIERFTGATTFVHWGATETGLGGGVECSSHNGCHLREAQLLVEIIDPLSGLVLADEEIGEVVISTLSREGMPLFRYRTGDIAALTREPCGCGGVTARLQYLRGRARSCPLPGDNRLLSQHLDNLLYTIEGLIDYRARLEAGSPDRFTVEYVHAPGYPDPGEAINRILNHIPELRNCVADGMLVVATMQAIHGFTPEHTMKRTIVDHRRRATICA